MSHTLQCPSQIYPSHTDPLYRTMFRGSMLRVIFQLISLMGLYSLIDLSKYQERWKLKLRKHDTLRDVDIWWEEIFDAVGLANGHYSVPFVFLPLSFPASPLTPCQFKILNPSSKLPS